MLNYYIDLGLTDAQSATGINAGQSINPYTFKQLVSNLKNSSYADNTNFYMKGAKYIPDFSAYSLSGSDGLFVAGSSAYTYTFLPWDVNQYGPWMLKIGLTTSGNNGNGLTIYNGPKLDFRQGILECQYLSFNSMFGGNPFYNKSYISKMTSMYIRLTGKPNDKKSTMFVNEGTQYGLRFNGSTVIIPEGYSFNIGTDQRLIFENSIFDVKAVYSEQPGINSTWFDFDNTCLTNSLSATSASNILSGGNVTGQLQLRTDRITENKNIPLSSWDTFNSMSASPTSAARLLTSKENFNYLKSNYLALLSGVSVPEWVYLDTYLYDDYSDSAYDPALYSGPPIVEYLGLSYRDNFTIRENGYGDLVSVSNLGDIDDGYVMTTSAISGDFDFEWQWVMGIDPPGNFGMNVWENDPPENSIVCSLMWRDNYYRWYRGNVQIATKYAPFSEDSGIKTRGRIKSSSGLITAQCDIGDGNWFSFTQTITNIDYIIVYNLQGFNPQGNNGFTYFKLQADNNLPYTGGINQTIGDASKALANGYFGTGLWSDYRDGVGALYFERPLLELSATPTEGDVPLIVNFSLPSTSANLVIPKTIRSGITNQTMAVGVVSADYTYNLAGVYSPTVSAQSYLRWNNEISNVLSVNTSGAVDASATFVMIDYIDRTIITSAHVGDIVIFSATSQTGVNRFVWDYDDSTSDFSATGIVQNVWHYYSSSGTYYPKLRVFNSFGSETFTSASLLIQNQTTESLIGHFVDINNAYDFSGIDVIHEGTSADPLNWKNFIDEIKVDGIGRNADTYRLKGTRRLYTYNSSITSDPVKIFTLDTWASYNNSVFSAYGPWMIITDSSASSDADMPNLNFENDILRNGIIYNKPVRINNIDYAGRINISEVYDMYINVMGKPYNRSSEDDTALTLSPRLLQDGVAFGVWNKMASSNIPNARGTNYLIVSEDEQYVYGTMDPYYLVRYPTSAGLNGQWEVVASASELGLNNNLFRMAEHLTTNKIYIGAGNSTSVDNPARLLVWTPGTNYLLTFAKLYTDETAIYSVIYDPNQVSSRRIHIGTNKGNVYKTSTLGVNHFSLVAPAAFEQTEIHDMVILSGVTYASTAYGGKLLGIFTSASVIEIVDSGVKSIYDHVVSAGQTPDSFWSSDFQNNFISYEMNVGEGDNGYTASGVSNERYFDMLSAGMTLSGDFSLRMDIRFKDTKLTDSIYGGALMLLYDEYGFKRLEFGYDAVNENLVWSDGQYNTETIPYPWISATSISTNLLCSVKYSEGYASLTIAPNEMSLFTTTFNLRQYSDKFTIKITPGLQNLGYETLQFYDTAIFPISQTESRSTYFEQVADTISAQEIIYDLIEHNGKIYGGSTSKYSSPIGGGKLLEWTGFKDIYYADEDFRTLSAGSNPASFWSSELQRLKVTTMSGVNVLKIDPLSAQGSYYDLLSGSVSGDFIFEWGAKLTSGVYAASAFGLGTSNNHPMVRWGLNPINYSSVLAYYPISNGVMALYATSSLGLNYNRVLHDPIPNEEIKFQLYRKYGIVRARYDISGSGWQNFPDIVEINSNPIYIAFGRLKTLYADQWGIMYASISANSDIQTNQSISADITTTDVTLLNGAWNVQADTYTNYYSVPSLASINENGTQKLFGATRAWGQVSILTPIQSFASIDDNYTLSSVGSYPSPRWNAINDPIQNISTFQVKTINGTNALVKSSSVAYNTPLRLVNNVFGDFILEFGAILSSHDDNFGGPFFAMSDNDATNACNIGWNPYTKNLTFIITSQTTHQIYQVFVPYATWKFRMKRTGSLITGEYNIGSGWIAFPNTGIISSTIGLNLSTSFIGLNETSMSYGLTYINLQADNINSNPLYIYYNKGFWNTPRTVGASVGAWAFTDTTYTGSGGDGGALLEWQPTLSAWSQRLGKYNNISSLAGLTTLTAQDHLYGVAVSGSTNDLLLLDFMTTHKIVNIVGSTIKVDSGVYDNETDEYQIRIIDSVLDGFSANPGYLENASYDVKNTSMDVKSTTFIQNVFDASLINNQYNWVPPTNYPFTRGNVGYGEDVEWLNTDDNKYYVKPFDGLSTPAEPGFYFSAYVDEYHQVYNTGLYNEQRTGIGAFYFGPRNSTISAGPFILNIYSNVAGAIVVEATSAFVDVSPVTIRLGLVYGQVINTTSDYEVDFVGVPIRGTSPLAVEFTDLTVVNQIGYEVKTRTWDFGDGTPVITTDRQKIVHVYSGYYGQKFDVSLTVTVGVI